MANIQLCSVLLVFHLLIIFALSDDEESNLQKIKLTAPNLSEDEKENLHMPDSLKCDACKAVSFQFYKELQRLEKRFQTRRPEESDIIEALETVCENGFNEYGLKEISGVNRLTGPGLDTGNVAGLVQMGGKWPKRIQDICLMFLGDIGELEIYSAYLTFKTKLEKFLCHGKNSKGYCKEHSKEKDAIKTNRANPLREEL